MVLSPKRNTSNCVVEIRSEGAALLRDACGAMVSQGSSAGVFNSLPWERLEVIQTQDGADKPSLGMLHIMSVCLQNNMFVSSSLNHESVVLQCW